VETAVGHFHIQGVKPGASGEAQKVRRVPFQLKTRLNPMSIDIRSQICLEHLSLGFFLIDFQRVGIDSNSSLMLKTKK